MPELTMYEMGFENGRKTAVERAFGAVLLKYDPIFETPQDEEDYWEGYDDGYYSVD